MPQLTDKQRKFCKYYLALGNASKAAKMAGYSEKAAGQAGFRLVNDEKIKAELKRLRLEIVEDLDIPTTGEILESYLRDLRFDPAKCFDKSGNSLPPKDIPPEARKGLKAFQVKPIYYSGRLIDIEYKYVFPDQQAVRQDLARFLGMFEKDNSQQAQRSEGLAKALREAFSAVSKDKSGD